MVHENWDSPETFHSGGDLVMPIVADVPIDPGEPAIMPIHRRQQTSQG